MRKNILKLIELSNRKSFDRYLPFQSDLKKISIKVHRRLFKMKLVEAEALVLADMYFKTKEEYVKLLIITILNQSKHDCLKSFYLKVYDFEKRLSMKFFAIRGYLMYASEEETTALLKKFELNLKKSSLDYREYEPLISVYGFPYLLNKYPYQTLKDTYTVILDNYQQIPKPLRGIFTLNKKGEVISLVTSDEAKARIKGVILKSKGRNHE